MINSLKKLLKKETGQVLPMALILLVLGGLLVVPMLSLMTTNLTANRVIEEENSGIYAADAGIQDAMWKLGSGIAPFSENTTSYVLSETVNGMTVIVEQEALDPGESGYLYTIRSTAILNGDNVTSIVAQAIAGANFHWLFNNAITSNGDINLSPGDIIYGDVVCSGDFNGDEDQVAEGDIVEGAEIIMPTEEMLTAYYLGTFDDEVRADSSNYWPAPDVKPYPYGTYDVPTGYTYSNPYMIPWLYCPGDLSITAASDTYAKLNGNIFIEGKFDLSDKDVTLDLNGYSIYARFSDYPDCNADAVYFGPDSYLNGPGCVIGVGNVNFQPSVGQGWRLIGAEEVATGTTTELGDRFALSRFQADKKLEGAMTSFQVKCYRADPEAPPNHVKVALYNDSGTTPYKPTTLVHLDAWAESDNITISSWKPVPFPETQLTDDGWYWMAAIADGDIISTRAVTSESKYQLSYFDGFSFPDDVSEVDFSDVPTKEYQFRGFTGSQEFLFLMSVECSTNLQPSANFYGSIAGNADVNLQPGCFINLVGTPEEGLQFPGSGTTGVSETGNAPPIINYNIE